MPADDAAETLRRIAANVKTSRERRGWSQAVLAERADLELRYLQRVERAECDFGVVELVRLARALGVKLDVLVRPADLGTAGRGRPRRGS